MFVPPGCFLGPQPNTLQHSLSPGRDAIRRDRDLEEIGGVGEGGEEAKSSHPSSLPPVSLQSRDPEHLLCAGHRHCFGFFPINLIESLLSPLRHVCLFPDLQMRKLKLGDGT